MGWSSLFNPAPKPDKVCQQGAKAMMTDGETMRLAMAALGLALAVSLTLFVIVLLRLREAQHHVREKETEYQKVLDNLKENDCRLRAIIESEPECVKLQNAEGTLLEVNPAGLKLMGADRAEDIVGKLIYSIVAPEYIDFYRQNMARVFAGETVIYEFKAITLKGKTAWLETHAVPMRDARGSIYALLGITRDITEHRLAEENARRHQTELTHVARLSTMGEMATGIAHELNQPLSAIANFARGCLLRLRSDNMNPADLIEPLEEVCEQAERASKILCHVRDFVRKSELQLKPLDINHTVHSVVKFTELEALQYGAVVKLNLDTQLPQVQADAIMIEQVLCNLVRNAFEAMAEAKLARREVAICTRTLNRHAIEIEVADTGPGIDGAVIDQVFDQFFTTKPEGVGMGLSISRSIIESHGGLVRAESPQSGGTSFRFTVPISEQQVSNHA
jgi:PAS domain S-box-containing protein